MSDTPKTDAEVTIRIDAMGNEHRVVCADFAREQERTIAELVGALTRMDAMHDLMMKEANHKASWYGARTLREMNEAPIEAARAIQKAQP